MGRTLSLAEIFQLGYYWECKVLLTAVKLDVFGALAEGAVTAADVSRRLQTDRKATEVLMNALASIGLLRKSGEQFQNAPETQEYLVKGSPRYAGHLLLLQEAEWDNWGRLESVVRSGRSPVKGHMFQTDPQLAENVLMVLHHVALQHAPTLAKQIDLSRAQTLLDLGGGAGTYALAFCRAYPALKATVFDLPETLRTTERLVKEAGLEGRVRLISGDFNYDELGGPYDAVLMSDVLHYQEAEGNAALVRKVHRALAPSGRLVIKDRFLDEGRTSPAWTAVFAVHILVNTERGRCYTMAEAIQWLKDAGFTSVNELERTTLVQGVK
jgi:ubiquinone/menaquinone biosynthesis C-methylase UbiE